MIEFNSTAYPNYADMEAAVYVAEDQAGTMGIHPYVHLGKRCVIGLGLDLHMLVFGCNLDAKLPGPDGTL